MKVVEKKHFGNIVGRNINNPDKVMAEVNIMRGLKHVSSKNIVTITVPSQCYVNINQDFVCSHASFK
jgi:hypothetical protein